MKADVEQGVDGLLEAAFGGSPIALVISNIVVGGIFLFAAWRLLISSRQRKARRVLAWIILTIGSLGTLSGVVQLVVKL
ncbi:hypothetical protein FHS18_003432 [Paenibacillus phyllosphaerae]|uniref:Uncharacterized protein n=1 Tax=Paenibacillus phyllosphaerae TaxID=274593 RepID=A0A7W5AZ13_9BACL|nr:hypothetical protein [Paenibacillus phyllosphaerae]MBB3111364.1 hypothetical protein [Paenibacillus phyllosphaerae]